MASLQAELEAERLRVAELTQERDRLRTAQEQLRLALELLRRRIFVAKAERVDSRQLELEFAQKLAALDALTAKLDHELANNDAASLDGSGAGPNRRRNKKPTGRRDLRKEEIPEVRIELPNPEMEALVAQGKAERFAIEESCDLAWQRGGYRRVIVARFKYRVPQTASSAESAAPPRRATPETTMIYTTPMPPRTFPRCMAAPSLLAHIAVEKYADGMPLYRIEQRAARDGVQLDRGTMSRWMEDVGSTLGATIVYAMLAEAKRTAFCFATDATGVSVQPTRLQDGKRQPCRRGHYFVMIADRDHIFFEYTPKETSAAVAEMFRGFSGYIQADAKSVFNILFRLPNGPPDPDDEADLGECKEVGCWVHARRGFWEAAFAKEPAAREALLRIGRFFEIEERWRGCPPHKIKRLRDQYLRPHVEAFFEWAALEYEKVRDQRGLMRKAFGYVIRQKAALMRFLDDGRLGLENNRSERELRRIAVGRKAWLFVGSDDHAASAGHIFSLTASCKLHGLDPEAYLCEVIRILAQWPKDRYLELAPKYWAATRARLDPAQLELEVAWITIPPPLAPAPPQQSSSD
jgi:hypothetical protein